MTDPGAIAPATPPGIRHLSDAEFRALRELIHAEAGIFLSEAKKALLVGRLGRRLRELGLTSFAEYHARARDDGEERARMLDCICTNETHFFREPEHFRLLRERVFPEWERAAAAGERPRLVRAWSAACSTGEEPFTLSMVLLERFASAPGWEVEICATDLSRPALERARRATWPIARATEIPPAFLKRFMLRGSGANAGEMRAGAEVCAPIRFGRLNLLAEAMPALGRFDLIFCRNVLIYFSAQARARVLGRLLECLAPDGYLLLGHAETLAGIEGMAPVIPTVYRRAAGERSGGGASRAARRSA